MWHQRDTCERHAMTQWPILWKHAQNIWQLLTTQFRHVNCQFVRKIKTASIQFFFLKKRGLKMCSNVWSSDTADFATAMDLVRKFLWKWAPGTWFWSSDGRKLGYGIVTRTLRRFNVWRQWLHLNGTQHECILHNMRYVNGAESFLRSCQWIS
jgi:hypothetical protein